MLTLVVTGRPKARSPFGKPTIGAAVLIACVRQTGKPGSHGAVDDGRHSSCPEENARSSSLAAPNGFPTAAQLDLSVHTSVHDPVSMTGATP
ncbi:hypothetical protein [Actinocrispum wychmicini]|uniref:hypothetical protein n=1 Tax=Actinocrispum wychmicini TaxID=1213861 RepID=UPI001053C295|nr:hypothetical protein [Actinocrispum wychmicini]